MPKNNQLKTNIILDDNQKLVLSHLNLLQRQIDKLFARKPILAVIKDFFVKPEPIKNLYIYGKVGRGKSMLMKHFFTNLTTKKKLYLHFNSFMQKMHQELFNLRKLLAKNTSAQQNLVALATKRLIKNAAVICFDEMQVEDVADAMILKGVFSYFIQSKTKVVITSNLYPLKLYKNGLQRDLFLQFINQILLPNFLVLNLDGKIDYRSQGLIDKRSRQNYFYPINHQNSQTIKQIIQQETNEKPLLPRFIKVLGRKLLIKQTYQKIAIFEFDQLCRENLGVADYQAICQEFSLIFILNLPVLKMEERNEAKRLMWLIDEIYENKIELIILAACKPQAIYLEGIGAKAFRRTASRLMEISNSSLNYE